MWIHLQDQNGTHYVFNVSLGILFQSTATDGSQPITMTIPSLNLQFFVTGAEFTELVGTLPTVNQVVLP